jgi:Type I phosphodiesterase / nucleotide pyrophosphatase
MRSSRSAFALGLILALAASCSLVAKTVVTQGERPLRPKPIAPAAPKPGPRVIVFCLDGAGYDQLMEAIRSGKAPHIANLLGKEKGGGVFEHGFSAPRVVNVLPSSTIADWSATFTGKPPALNGVPGDEWFDRGQKRFYAPIPISVTDTSDFSSMLNDDLIGRQLKVPTLYERLRRRSYVSMLMVYRGATLFTTVSSTAFAGLVGDLVEGTLTGETALGSISTTLDLDSTTKLLDAINEHGVPRLQIVYFPGIDLFTHASPHPLKSQVGYIEDYTDKAVGDVLAAYQKLGVLPYTYAIFIADHGHTPVMDDDRHRLGPDDPGSPFAVLQTAGFRLRKASLSLTPDEQDYQAVLASQGFMAYVYLANRSTCPNKGDVCDWNKPPRFRADLMQAARAIYLDNQSGSPVPQAKGTIDLIFARKPVSPGRAATPFEVFDGRRLVPIDAYLKRHPRRDLVDLKQRMEWLGDGPYGYLAGDIVLLANASTAVPVQKRYYFSTATHYSWHGSANLDDSHIPLILASPEIPGESLRRIVRDVGGSDGGPFSQMELTPLVLALLGR